MSNSQDDIDDDGASSIYCPSAGKLFYLNGIMPVVKVARNAN